MAYTVLPRIMATCDKCVTMGILLPAILAAVLGSPHSFEGSCPDSISDVTSQCLATYSNKIQHMHRNNQNFYTGIDMEEMRSICSAMRRAIKCVTDTKASCPNLEEAAYPSDLIAVYHLCHYNNFHEVYSINQFCYASVRQSTDRCYQRFQTSTNDNPAATRHYCSQFEELVNCIWAIASSNCGEQAADLVEALVRPAVAHSDQCVEPASTTTTTASTTPVTQKLHRYHEQDNANSDLNNDQNNSEQPGSASAQNLHLFSWICLVFILNFVGIVAR